MPFMPRRKAPKARPAELYHPIRIVPLHPGKAKAAAPQVPPKLTYRNGPLLASVQIFTIFWGAAWNNAPQDALLPKVNQFFDFIPPGVTVTQGGSASCKVFCGYHDAINNSIFYAVMPYPGCAGCLGGIAAFDALTSTTSHELCEAITDPIPGQGWYDDNNGEIGDICAWQTRTLGGYTIQLEWSNAANRCREASPGNLFIP